MILKIICIHQLVWHTQWANEEEPQNNNINKLRNPDTLIWLKNTILNENIGNNGWWYLWGTIIHVTNVIETKWTAH